MKDNEFIKDVCCEYCKKFDTDDCPVKTASPWSRWDFCNNFRDKDNKAIAEILEQSYFEKTKQIYKTIKGKK